MLVRNEDFQFVTIKDYANQLLEDGLGFDAVTEQEAEDALAELIELSNSQYYGNMFSGEVESLRALSYSVKALIDKKKLLKEVKKAFCKIAKDDSTFKGIVEIILEAIGSVIPGGVLVVKLVKIIVKYLIGVGVKKICS